VLLAAQRRDVEYIRRALVAVRSERTAIRQTPFGELALEPRIELFNLLEFHPCDRRGARQF
jgi:hypothetical protein